MTDTGEIVKLCRKSLNWTKVKLQEESGVPLNTIITIERNSNCRFHTFEKLIEAMGFEIEILPKEYR